MFMGIERGALETHVKAHRAADSALWLILHALGARKPVVGVVVRIHEGDAALLRKSDVLVLAQLVFLLWMDIRIVEEDRKIDAALEHRFHDLARTGGAAGVQQHL